MAALARVGVEDCVRASTRITARAATALQALHLDVREGARLIYTTVLNIDPSGRSVEFGRTWFVGDRLTLTMDGLE